MQRETGSMKPGTGITSLLHAAQAACVEIGIVYCDVPTDGRFYGVAVEGKAKKNHDGRIKIFPDLAGGIAWNHVTGEHRVFWSKDENTLSPAEVIIRRGRQALEIEETALLREDARHKAAHIALAVWEEAELPKDNRYLQRKQVKPTATLREMRLSNLVEIIGYTPKVDGVPLAGDRILIVPVGDFEGLTSIEMIDGEGKKPALRHGKKKGCFWVTGELPKEGADLGTIIGIGEGVATVLTWHMATGRFGVAALCAGNLKAVAETYRKSFPYAKIVIISDIGKGEEDAREAAKATRSILLLPQLPSESAGTDLNDMQVLLGASAVNQLIESTLTSVTPLPAVETVGALEKHMPFPMSTLIQKQFAPPRWAIPGLLPEGLAILSGPPKIGKSWLVMDICLAVATGGTALGFFTAPRHRVLLLSLEDNERRLQARLLKRVDPTSDLTLFVAQDQWSPLDAGGLVALDSWLAANPDCRLVVIDTIQKIKSRPTRRSGTAYEHDYEAYGALQRLALNRQCCILLIHHNRKTDSRIVHDPLEAISGSTGITGTMDTIMMLSRPRGGTGAALTVTGRDIPEGEYSLTFDNSSCSWTVLGTSQEASLQEGSNSTLVLEHLKRCPGKYMSVADVHSELEGAIVLESVKTALYRLERKGLLRKERGTFAYLDTVKLVKPETPPSAGTSTGISSFTGVISSTTNSSANPEVDASLLADLVLPDFEF